KCDVPAGFTTFSNVLFDAYYDSDSSDDQSLSDEDVPKKIYSNPLFDEEIIPMAIDPHSFNAESDIIKSITNNDSSIIIPSKIDSLFDEFAGELTLLKWIPPGIDETDCHLEEEIRLTKRLLYDNSSPRPLEEIVSDNSNADIESFSPSPIPIKDSDSYMEEIDLFCTPYYPMPPGIEDKDVVEDISPTKEPQVLNTLPTHPTLQLNMKFQPSSESLFAYVVWIYLSFLVYSVVPCYLLSLRNEDIIFDPGICKYHFSRPDISHRLSSRLIDFSKSNDEFSSIDDDSFSIDNIDYVAASPPDSELASSKVMEIIIPEVGGIDDDILLTIKDEILREKMLNVNLRIAKIESLNDNPTSSSNCKTKSSFTSLNSLLDETNTFDNSLPEFETFCFDVEEISSGNTTTHSDISLQEYEVFYNDHVKEISSGSPTTHSDSSLYASFIFDLLINLFPSADRSDFYEFTDELIPFISPLEYDCFLFKVEPNSGDFTKDVVKDISLTKEPQVHNAFPTHPTLQLIMKFQPSSESLFTYVVWLFFPFLVYSVAPHYLLSLRNEDTIFDPGICNSHFSRPNISHRCGTFSRFNVLPDRPMKIFSSTCSPMDK
nr:hypothetical protein [Tanacetum cinerariifolium]